MGDSRNVKWFLCTSIFLWQNHTFVMATTTFLTDLGEDRTFLLHKERWSKKNEDAGFQLHFIWTLCICRIHNAKDEDCFLTTEEMPSSLWKKKGRIANFSKLKIFCLCKILLYPQCSWREAMSCWDFMSDFCSPKLHETQLYLRGIMDELTLQVLEQLSWRNLSILIFHLLHHFSALQDWLYLG